MTRFLLDEMYPPAAAATLRDTYGHDPVHVSEVGLRGAADSTVAAEARSDRRVLVTENVANVAGERDVVLVFVMKRRLPAGGAQAAALADLLGGWAAGNSEPYVGPHWP